MTRHTGPLIGAQQLASWLDSPAPPVLIDVSWQLGAASLHDHYAAAHLPGAAWVEFEGNLSAEAGADGRHPLPDMAAFETAMRAAGVSNDRSVVVYDQGSSLAASRAWWLLEYAGHEAVQVLDGGLAGWRSLELPLSSAPVTPEPGDFVATPPNRLVLEAEDVLEYADRGMLLDARPGERFHGRGETVDPVAGHIPGAVSVPALENLQEDGRFLPSDDLAMRLTMHGVTPHTPVAVYCGSGVQAMHLALAMEVAGLDAPTGVYVGSWSHWITDPERPIAR